MAKVFVVTAAQSYASPHAHFWAGLLAYAKRRSAEIIVLPMIGKSSKEDWDAIHPLFAEYLEYGKRSLNSNVKIEQFNIRPYQVDPVTGLDRFAQRDTSVIFASPKQRLKPVPHSNQKFPKFLITTGSVTRPNYATQSDSSAERRRLGEIARRDHTYGAVVVEVVDNNHYHLRHLRANSKGEFVDLGILYSGNETKKVSPEALVLGDYHFGVSDQNVLKTTYEMIDELKPKRIVLHDFFDGHSVSHWSEKVPVRDLLLQVFDKGLFTLAGELMEAGKELMKLSKMADEVIVVMSNHHRFLHRYLEDGRWAKHPHNYRLAVELLGHMAEKDHNDPVEYGIKKFSNLPKNVKFLREDADYKVRGYQLAAHGDKSDTGGSFGGGYGGVASKEIAYGRSITGHVHKQQILRDTYTVGTCLPINPPPFYMRGRSIDWTHTHAVLWSNGTVQLLSIFDGEWRA